MDLPPKTVSVIGLIQVVLIVYGFGVAHAFLHLKEVATPSGFAHYVPLLAVFVGHYGLWLTLIPVIWAAVSACRGDAACGLVSVLSHDLIIGVALTLMLIVIVYKGVIGAAAF